MQTKDLIKVWTAPDNTRLTHKQLSIRLPIHVAAKIAALCEMFPQKTKTEIIGDLLATALDDVTEGLSNEPYPSELGESSLYPEEESDDSCWGDRNRYNQLLTKYLKEMELDGDETQTLEESKHSARPQAKGDSEPLTEREDGPRVARGRRTRAGGRK